MTKLWMLLPIIVSIMMFHIMRDTWISLCSKNIVVPHHEVNHHSEWSSSWPSYSTLIFHRIHGLFHFHHDTFSLLRRYYQKVEETRPFAFGEEAKTHRILRRKRRRQSTPSQLPLQVFVLSGQSNMVGRGSMDHLDYITQSKYNDSTFRHMLWNDTITSTSNGSYYKRYDITMKYGLNLKPAGYLTCGRLSGFAYIGRFGPELMFGYTIGDYFLKQQQQVKRPNVLLLKIAWDGRSLAVDYRPPSSGIGNYTNVAPTQYGVYYRELIHDTLASLHNISSFVPNFNKSLGYQLRGFVWLQGYNDLIDPLKVKEYQSNLATFIRDVRLDLDAPDLPFVIGELGMHGVNATDPNVLAMRRAQQNVCLLPENQRTTSFVRTAPYAVLNGAAYDGIHHYYGRADTCYHIGQALGYGMIDLLQNKLNKATNQPMNPQTNHALHVVWAAVLWLKNRLAKLVGRQP